MPAEYDSIKDSLKKSHPFWSIPRVEEKAARTFSKVFETDHHNADKLDTAGKWQAHKMLHGIGVKSELGIEVKAVETDKGRFIEYDVASTGLDKAMGISDEGKLWRGDNLLPECIDDAAIQMQNAIGAMYDPSTVRDMDEINRPNFTGTGHEHTFDSKHIIPITTTVQAKAVTCDGKRKLRVVDKVNEFSSRADDFWNMVNTKILSHASIEFRPVDYYFQEIGGVLQRFVKKIQVFGKTFTGRPANNLAGIINLSVKAVHVDNKLYNDLVRQTLETKTEGDSMEEEKVVTPTPAEEQKPTEAPKEEPKKEEAPQEEIKSLKETISKLTKDLEEVKARQVDKNIIDTPSIEAVILEKFENIKAEQKNLVAADQEKFDAVETEVKTKLDEVKSEPTFENGLKIHRELESKGLINYDF